MNHHLLKLQFGPKWYWILPDQVMVGPSEDGPWRWYCTRACWDTIGREMVEKATKK